MGKRLKNKRQCFKSQKVQGILVESVRRKAAYPNIMLRKRSSILLEVYTRRWEGELAGSEPSTRSREDSKQRDYLYEVVICTWDCCVSGLGQNILVVLRVNQHAKA